MLRDQRETAKLLGFTSQISITRAYLAIDMDNYEEIKFLGKGGFGAAYLVKDKRDQKKCVVKVNYEPVCETIICREQPWISG